MVAVGVGDADARPARLDVLSVPVDGLKDPPSDLVGRPLGIVEVEPQPDVDVVLRAVEREDADLHLVAALQVRRATRAPVLGVVGLHPVHDDVLLLPELVVDLVVGPDVAVEPLEQRLHVGHRESGAEGGVAGAGGAARDDSYSLSQ